jgi:hypothetical protein
MNSFYFPLFHFLSPNLLASLPFALPTKSLLLFFPLSNPCKDVPQKNLVLRGCVLFSYLVKKRE